MENKKCSETNNMKQGKRIICLQGKSSIGKSGTINALIRKLMPKSTKTIWNHPPQEPDLIIDEPYCHYNVEVWVKGMHIGLDNEGDYTKILHKYLTKLANKEKENQCECDIIFCTCRTKGGTPKVVDKVAGKFGYSVISTAPYILWDYNEKKTKKLNELKAEHLEAFI